MESELISALIGGGAALLVAVLAWAGQRGSSATAALPELIAETRELRTEVRSLESRIDGLETALGDAEGLASEALSYIERVLIWLVDKHPGADHPPLPARLQERIKWQGLAVDPHRAP